MPTRSSARCALSRPARTKALEDDDVPELPEEPVTKPGDLWVLGEHRLLCGDATKCRRCRERLLSDGETVDAVITDPPYGVEYEGKTREALRIENDGAVGLAALLDSSLGLAKDRCRDGATWFVFGPAGPQALDFAQVLARLQVLRQILVWSKDSMVLGHSDYHYKHEFVFYGWKPGAKHVTPPDRKQTSVWEFDRPKANREHPTMKPVKLVAKAIANGTKKGALVYDPFSGSGTTLIAAEKLGRRVFGLEIDPRYADVIVRRFEIPHPKGGTP